MNKTILIARRTELKPSRKAQAAPTILRKVTIGVVGASLCASAVATNAIASSASAASASESATATTSEPTPRAKAQQVSKRVIGRSVQGRKIVARLYGSPDATKVGVIIGSMHGTEWAGSRITKRLRTKGAPKGTAMWVIRTINPDGHLRKQRGNANGVDLNRNGSHLWQGTARAPVYYPGPSAMSEPETRAYVSFLADMSPDVVLIYHQAGNGVDSYRQKNKGLTDGLAARMKLPVKSFNCDGECTGTLTGWFNNTLPGTALTVELTRNVGAKQVKRWTRSAKWAIRYIPDV